jgi:hypothetical protein
VAEQKLMDRARDELFSHINRCGVLEASEEDQKHWMDETIEYLAERYPDLSDGNLRDLYSVGMNFCKPAIAYAAGDATGSESDQVAEGAAAAGDTVASD